MFPGPESGAWVPRWLAACCLAALAACGGGGGGPAGDPDPAPLPPSSAFASRCVNPRVLSPTQPYLDSPGTLADEKAFVRSWVHETYLWYRELPVLDPAPYASAQALFADLRTPALTASGQPKDRFHYTVPTAEWEALSDAGIEAGYGIVWAVPQATPPRRVLVAQVAPGSPAAAAGIARGAEVLAVDGVDMVNGTDVTALNKGLYPSAAGQPHAFRLLDRGASVAREVALTSARLSKPPVPEVRTFDAPAGKVGYLLFNDHIATAEAALADAIRQFRSAGIVDLVLDVRYNGGGLLDVAAELAYMIAGPQATAGKDFERLRFNDKNPFGFSAEQQRTPFHATARGFSLPLGQELPSLGLGRVFVLSSRDTCSASESIINGLRGAGVAVHQVGSTTCGKPYGFYPRENCGTMYFSIQFEGVNHLGEGGYVDGLAPGCSVADDFDHLLGDPAEAQLAAALGWQRDGVCTAAASARQALAAPSAASRPDAAPGPALLRPFWRSERVLRPVPAQP